mgnify:FL=1
MEYRSSSCSSRKYTSSSPAATTPKKEPTVVTTKKDIKTEKEAAAFPAASQAVPVAKDIKNEEKETAAVKQEPVKLNVGVRGGGEPSRD